MRLFTCINQKGLRSLERKVGYGNLKKALFSLKQGGCEWYHCINDLQGHLD